MVKRAAMACLLLSVMLIAGVVSPAEGQNVPRLIADNRTPYVVELYAWNGVAWNHVRRIAPNTWQAFPNAANGSYWRAMIGQAIRDHRVEYRWHPDYGGYQDVWLIY